MFLCIQFVLFMIQYIILIGRSFFFATATFQGVLTVVAVKSSLLDDQFPKAPQTEILPQLDSGGLFQHLSYH